MNEYEDRLEQQARQYVAKAPLSLGDTRQLLVLSAATCCRTAQHYFNSRLSDPDLLDKLLATVRDVDGFFSGDARIQAAHYLRSFDRNLLHARSRELLALYDKEDGEGAGGCLRPLLALSLTRGRSHGGRERIVRDLDPQLLHNVFFEDALRDYDQFASESSPVQPLNTEH